MSDFIKKISQNLRPDKIGPLPILPVEGRAWDITRWLDFICPARKKCGKINTVQLPPLQGEGWGGVELNSMSLC
jgi:hypothetical protein